ncbi:hypothetical protein C7B61_15230, partial [filamentous cyanobacterium CCP1]
IETDGLVSLEHYDFSNLDLRQAYLQNIRLRDVNCQNAELSTTLFTDIIGDVFAVCCDAGGNFLAAGDTEGKIHVWQFLPHSKTVTKYRSWQGHTSGIRTVAFHPENQVLMSGSDDRTIKRWDIHTGQCLETRSGKDWVRSAQFSPDGSLFAVGSDDYSVQLRSVLPDGQPITLTNDSHIDRVRTVAFSPNGEQLASSGDDHIIILWNIAQRQSVQRLEGHTARVRSLAFSPDSQWLASCGDDHTVLLWNLASLASGQTMPERKYTEHCDRVRAVAFSPDGQLLISGGDDGRIWVRDQTKQSPLKLEGSSAKHIERVQSIAFKPNSRILVSGHDNQTLKLWDLNRNVALKKLKGFTSGLQALQFIDNHTLISGCNDHRIQIWDVKNRCCVKTLEGHIGRITALTLGQYGLAKRQYGLDNLRVLASGSDDCTVKLWDIRSGNCLQTFSNLTHWVRSVVFSPTGKTLAVAGDDQCIHLWEVGHSSVSPKILKGHKHWVRSIAFSPDPDQPLLASGGDDQIVQLWDTKTGKSIKSLDKHQHRIQAVTFSPNGAWLASGSDDATVRISDVRTGELVRILQPHSDESDSQCGIKSIAFSPDGSLLASANEGGMVRLWSLSAENCQILIDPGLGERSHQMGVQSVVFSPDGQTLASSSRNGEIKLWTVPSGMLQETLTVDRLYTGMDITGARGLSDVQRATLLELGAFDQMHSAFG